ncbi:MAG: ATP-binding protein, partial [Rhodocyclaceae bacterium]|nr:ATP-binding protein [Rhodocyclaceae bacterium]
MKPFWPICLDYFEQELPAQQFNTWIKTLRADESVDGELRLTAPNRFVLQWVRDRYVGMIESLALEQLQRNINVRVGLPEPAPRAATPAPQVPAQRPQPSAVTATTAHAKAAPGNGVDKSRLNPTFTFDTLVSGRANDLARAAALQVASNPGKSYNPLFIYGGVGLGKTHLIHALGNQVAAQNPDLVIRYVHAEDYYADVVRAYQQKSFDIFKRYYRSLDLLLIDDIQF